jgi:RNA-directed DNA polymerase
MKGIIQERLKGCNLELNETKTKIVYCKDSNRKENYDNIQFDFLGYTFRPRPAKNRRGEYFCSFLPAISNKSKKKIGEVMRTWWKTSRTDIDLIDIAVWIDPIVRGWITYYGRYYPSALVPLFKRLNLRLAIWVTKKYKSFRGHRRRAMKWLFECYQRHPNLFAHWQSGYKPVQPRFGGNEKTG